MAYKYAHAQGFCLLRWQHVHPNGLHQPPFLLLLFYIHRRPFCVSFVVVVVVAFFLFAFSVDVDIYT